MEKLGKLIDEFIYMEGQLQLIKYYGRLSRLKEYKFKKVLNNYKLRGRSSRGARDKDTNKGVGKKSHGGEEGNLAKFLRSSFGER
jgi:hypothetical protein